MNIAPEIRTETAQESHQAAVGAAPSSATATSSSVHPDRRRARARELFARADSMDPDELTDALYDVGLQRTHPNGTSSAPEATVLNAAQIASLMFALTTMKRHGLSVDSSEPCGAILALDAGLGKTLSALGVVAAAKAAGIRRALVVCPGQVVRNWAIEAIRFFGPTFRILCVEHHDRDWEARESGLAPLLVRHPNRETMDGCDIVVVSSSAFKCIWGHYTEDDPTDSDASAVVRRAIMTERWGVLVVDESHHLRNPKTKLVAACRALVPSKIALFLSGTPLVNKGVDLSWQLRLCGCDDIPEEAAFARMVKAVTARESGADFDGLAAVMHRHMLTIHKEQVSSQAPQPCQHVRTRVRAQESHDATSPLPPPEKVPRSVAFRTTVPDGWRVYTPGHGTVPAAFGRRVQLEVNGRLAEVFKLIAREIRKAQGNGGAAVLSAMTLLRMASESVENPSGCLDAALRHLGIRTPKQLAALSHPKPQWLAKYVQGLPGDEKVVVFCHFVGTVRTLERHLKRCNIGVATMTSEVAAGKDREDVINTFQRDPSVRVLIATHLCDEGLNMQAANHVINMAPWWNSKKDEQAAGRLHRIGQTRNVFVTWLTVKPDACRFITDIEETMVNTCMNKLRDIKALDVLGSVYSDSAEQCGLARKAVITPRFCCDTEATECAPSFTEEAPASTDIPQEDPLDLWDADLETPDDSAPVASTSSSPSPSTSPSSPKPTPASESPVQSRKRVKQQPRAQPAPLAAQAPDCSTVSPQRQVRIQSRIGPKERARPLQCSGGRVLPASSAGHEATHAPPTKSIVRFRASTARSPSPRTVREVRVTVTGSQPAKTQPSGLPAMLSGQALLHAAEKYKAYGTAPGLRSVTVTTSGTVTTITAPAMAQTRGGRSAHSTYAERRGFDSGLLARLQQAQDHKQASANAKLSSGGGSHQW
jgi:hypothetical protein